MMYYDDSWSAYLYFELYTLLEPYKKYKDIEEFKTYNYLYGLNFST